MLKHNVKIATHIRNIRENILTDKKVRNHLMFMTVLAGLYALMHVYVGVRGWQAFGEVISSPVYIGVLAFLALLYPLSFVLLDQGREDRPIPKAIAYLGYYWAAFFLYAVLTLLSIDLLRLLNNLSRHQLQTFLPAGFPVNLPAAGISVVFFVAVILAVGTIMARHPKIKTYQLVLNKPMSANRSLRVVLLSDIHYGSLVSSADLNRMSEQVNQIQPDIVLLAGDIIDNSIDLIRKTPFVEQISKLRARFGVFAVLGNHEYANAAPADVIELMQQAGIEVLKDETRLIDDRFYLCGRNEKRSEYSGLLGQMDPRELTRGLDKSLPILMMQHQPHDLPLLDLAGVDVAVAGHTHNGQMFPMNLLSKGKFAHNFGFHRMGRLQNIISAGYGTWGPPIRIGSRSEIVLMEISGSKG